MHRWVGSASLLILTSVALCGSAVAGQNELVVLGYGGSCEQHMRSSVIPPFEQRFQAKVTYVGGVGSANLAKVRLQASRPQADVLFTSPLTQVQGEAFGLFDAIDQNLVTHLKDVFEHEFRRGGLGVSFGRYVIGIEYHTGTFKAKGWQPPASWYDLFRPEMKGHLVVQSLASDMGLGLFVSLTRREGGTERQADPGFKFFTAVAPNVLTFNSAPAELDNLFRQGEAWIAAHSNQRAYILKDLGAPVDFVLPKEGGVLMTNQAAVVKGAPRRELAQRFVNHLLDPAIQKAMAEALVYGPTNRLVTLAPAVTQRVPQGGAEPGKYILVDWEAVRQSYSTWIDRWNREVERK